MFGRKKKFVLVDPSFDGKGGDKWQYAMAFLDSAIANDFEFVLLANKRSPLISSEGGTKVNQKNIFDYGFYMHGEVAGRHASGPRRKSLRGADMRANRRIDEYNSGISERRGHHDSIGEKILIAKRDEFVRAYIKERSEKEEDAEREEPIPQPFNRDDFARSMAQEIRSLKLGKGDVIFLHTATQGMMESLSEISLYLDEPVEADAYFLFHFGAEAPDARTFIDRYYSYSHFETLKLRLATGSPFKRIYLLATSSQLRDELEGFLGLPVGLFDGLTNFSRYLDAVGGEQRYRAARDLFQHKVTCAEFLIGVRVADLDDDRFKMVKSAVDILTENGINVRVVLAYHNANRARAVRYFAETDQSKFQILNTELNDDYLKFLINSSLIVLPYRTEVYKKRVSAVLHDCAVLGISCVVPRGTPLEDGRSYADIYAYTDLNELPGIILRAISALTENPLASQARVEKARQLFASDVIERLLNSMHEPSLTTTGRGRVATVVMPLWGRVGSSYAIESQIRFLMEQGYFVVQVFALDKPAHGYEAIPYFWRMIYENSLKMRANIQRIAFREKDLDSETLSPTANAFDIFLENIGENSLWDQDVERLTKSSLVTVVNHVFNSRLAKEIGGGKFILETHDIQSRQMVHWPLRNPVTGEPESYEKIFNSELNEVEKYDYIINVSEAEHRELKIANANAVVITPYIPPNDGVQKHESIGAMSYDYGWDSNCRKIYKFDLLLLGDSHPANVESALWFINEVFRPHFGDQEITLGVVGRVCSALQEKIGHLDNVFYCGFVDDIADVRALSNIVVLPDQRGSGISIKTLETLAYAAPFVGTKVAFRGLADALPSDPPMHDSPGEFAARLLELVRDESKRNALGEAAWEMYLALAEKEVSDKAWLEVFYRLELPVGDTSLKESAS